MGPQHPSTHGVLRVVLKLDGEKVVDLDPVLGYLHRGVEKLCENADYHQAICYLDPLEYVSSLFCEWPGVMAFEKPLDTEYQREALRKTDTYILEAVPVFVANDASSIIRLTGINPV